MSVDRVFPARAHLWMICCTSVTLVCHSSTAVERLFHTQLSDPRDPLPRPCLNGRTRPGWPRFRPGRRTDSGSSACRRCSSGSAIRSGRSTRSTSSGRRASRPRRARSRRCSPPRGSAPAPTRRRTWPGWWERLDTDAAGFETAIARVRAAAEALDATQFELLTAAAFADFAARGVEVAAVEAGLGGRLDATNVARRARRAADERRPRAHRDPRATRARRSRRRSSRWRLRGRSSCSPTPSSRRCSPTTRSGWAARARRRRLYLGRPIDHDVEVRLAGRLEVNGSEVRDGAHTPDAVDWLLERLPEPGGYVGRRLDPGATRTPPGSSRASRAAGSTLVATQSTNERALPAEAVAASGEPSGSTGSRRSPTPRAALLRARELGPRVLVTGSLYLLADLAEC